MNINFRNPADTLRFIRTSFHADQRRLCHIEVIATQVRHSAEQLKAAGGAFSDLNTDLAYCAALLHDIGYLAEARVKGFHPSDGAQFLRGRGFGDLADLIEGHNCSPEEAALLGFAPVTISADIIAKLVTYWDMRVKQGGDIVPYEERLQDILARYGADSIVGRANLSARPRLEALSTEIEALLKATEQNRPPQSAIE